MTFQPGRSGNPSGRPKEIPEVTALARAHTVEAFEKQLEILRGEDQRLALAASLAILNRGWGTPTQHIAAEHSGSIATEMEPTEITRRLAHILVGEVAKKDEETRH